MILHAFSTRMPKQGDILVYFSTPDFHSGTASLVLIEALQVDEVTIAPFGPLADAGDDDALFTSIPLSLAERHLAYPELEKGDKLTHRGRPAVVRETRAHDWHVTIEYSDSNGGQFYGNVIWMDFQPTLDELT